MTPRLTGSGDLLLCACANIGVTVDGKVVVGRRLHHRAGVHRRRPQGQSSPLCTLASVGGGMAAGAAFAHPRAAVGRRSGPSDLFQPYVT